MNEEQITAKLMHHEGEIAGLWQHSKSAHKRIDENERVTEGIHRLAANVEAMTVQIQARPP